MRAKLANWTVILLPVVWALPYQDTFPLTLPFPIESAYRVRYVLHPVDDKPSLTDQMMGRLRGSFNKARWRALMESYESALYKGCCGRDFSVILPGAVLVGVSFFFLQLINNVLYQQATSGRRRNINFNDRPSEQSKFIQFIIFECPKWTLSMRP
jgi:hypothetical protein